MRPLLGPPSRSNAQSFINFPEMYLVYICFSKEEALYLLTPESTVDKQLFFLHPPILNFLNKIKNVKIPSAQVMYNRRHNQHYYQRVCYEV
jgi:hypothetical protein